MKVIIAGPRDFEFNYGAKCLLVGAIELCGFDITEVVSGGATGVDALGEAWAKKNEVPVKPFPYPDGHGKSGGPIRNAQMAEYADALILIWGADRTPGTSSMKREARRAGIPIFEVVLNKYEYA